MRHDWKTESGSRVIGEPRKRECRNCGAIQEYREQNYDRLLGGSFYAWRPLAGRCYAALKRLREAGLS